jgi:alpha-tubulin suppressor-like RCC1 family protein
MVVCSFGCGSSSESAPAGQGGSSTASSGGGIPNVGGTTANNSGGESAGGSVTGGTLAGGAAGATAGAHAGGAAETGGKSSDTGAQGGALEDGSVNDAASSTSITSTPIAAAVTHACAIRNGAAYCWGENQFGQIGNGSQVDSHVPTPVEGLTSGVQGLAAGFHSTSAIVEGAAYWWGYAGVSVGTVIPIKVTGLNFGVQSIAAYANAACAVASGAVYCWGYSLSPSQVAGLQASASAVTMGWGARCAIVAGAAYCWGINGDGEIGNGAIGDLVLDPVQVQGVSSGATAVAAGWYHTCAVMSGDVYCWGANDYGQLGHLPPGNDNTCLHTGNPPSEPCNPVPAKVVGLPGGVSTITAGTYHTCALANGAAYCWGGNTFGQLGNGQTIDSFEPVQVQGLTTGVTAIAANGYKTDPTGIDITCAAANGDIYCWGANNFGQLGDGTTNDSSVPVKVQFPDVVDAG